MIYVFYNEIIAVDKSHSKYHCLVTLFFNCPDSGSFEIQMQNRI